MDFIARGGILGGAAPVLILLMLGSPAAAAQNAKPKHNLLLNLALCNGSDRSSPELQIRGCTTIIDLGGNTPGAAIAYNNRGNAYAEKADYDQAVEDFDQSIRLNPNNAKPFNNRGAVYLKKGEYELAIKNLERRSGSILTTSRRSLTVPKPTRERTSTIARRRTMTRQSASIQI